MSSFMGGRYTLDSISLADLSPSQTRWPGHGRGRSPWPSRNEWRPACTILGGGIPAIHPSARNRNSANFAFWGFCELRLHGVLGSRSMLVVIGGEDTGTALEHPV